MRIHTATVSCSLARQDIYLRSDLPNVFRTSAQCLSLDINLLRFPMTPVLIEYDDPIFMLEWHNSRNIASRCRDNDTMQDFICPAIPNANHTNGIVIRLVEAIQVGPIIHSRKTRMWGELEIFEAWYRPNLYAQLETAHSTS